MSAIATSSTFGSAFIALFAAPVPRPPHPTSPILIFWLGARPPAALRNLSCALAALPGSTLHASAKDVSLKKSLRLCSVMLSSILGHYLIMCSSLRDVEIRLTSGPTHVLM